MNAQVCEINHYKWIVFKGTPLGSGRETHTGMCIKVSFLEHAETSFNFAIAHTVFNKTQAYTYFSWGSLTLTSITTESRYCQTVEFRFKDYEMQNADNKYLIITLFELDEMISNKRRVNLFNMVSQGHCQRLEYISINNSLCCSPENVLDIKFSIFD